MDNSGEIFRPLLLLSYCILPKDNPLLQYKTIFWIATIPAVLGVLILIFMVRDSKVQIATSTTKVSLKQLPRNFYLFLVIIAIFTLGNSTDSLLFVRTSETGISASWVPFIYMLFNTVSVFFAIPIGKLSDRIGRGRLITVGFFIYSMVYFMFGAFNNVGIFVGMFVMYGLYSALTDTCQKSLVSDLIPKEMKGKGSDLACVFGVMLLGKSDCRISI